MISKAKFGVDSAPALDGQDGARAAAGAAIRAREERERAEAAVLAQAAAQHRKAVAAAAATPEGQAAAARRDAQDRQARKHAADAEAAIERNTITQIVNTAAGPRISRTVDPRGAREAIRSNVAGLLSQGAADSNGYRQ